MATEFDTEFIALALELINEAGKQVAFKTVSQGAYDAATGKVAGGTVSTFSSKVSPPEAYHQRYIDGDTVQVGDVSIMLPSASAGFVPAINTVVTIDGLEWRVVGFNPVYSGEQVALYKLQLRR